MAERAISRYASSKSAVTGEPATGDPVTEEKAAESAVTGRETTRWAARPEAGSVGASRRRRTAARHTGTLLALLAAGGGLAAQPVHAAVPAHKPRPRLGSCAAGQLCLWGHDGFAGKRRTYELSDVNIESCVPLPRGVSAGSYANRTGRPVTLYQSGECKETGEFKTYPSGSWTPSSSYRVRALKIWER